MKIEIHIHNHGDKEISEQLNKLNTKLNTIMGKLEDIQAQLDNITTAADNIAADITKLTGTISGGLTADEADGVIAKLATIAENLKNIADITPEG